jgi:long-chain acyl-CoA synthetase
MDKPLIIPDLLRDRVAAERDRVALAVAGSGSMSYGEWEKRSNSIARGLTELGVTGGDRVGLYFENTEWLEYAVAYMATLKSGAIAVPLSSRFTDEDIESILERCGAIGVIRGGRKTRGPGWSATVPELETGRSDEPFRASATPDDVAEILYTSGTTGRPQGMACRHAHVIRPLVDGAGWPPRWWCKSEIYLHANAVSTTAGQLRLLEPLGPQRMTTVALPTFTPDRFCALAEQHRAAVVQLVPAMAGSILESGAHHGRDLSSVQIVSLGCAPLPPAMVPKLAAVFPRARLVNMYELTEARHAGTTFVYGPGQDGGRDGSVGRARGATQIRITDDKGRDVAAGVVGEVRLRWPGLPPQHYFRDARATARVFVDGWTRTGDSGYLDESGYLYLVDRIKDVIIKGGINIGSLEIENALREHPSISDCAVVGVPDHVHGEEVAAALVTRQSVSPYELRKFLSGKLAQHKIPQRYLELAMLPRNRSGKVLKRELRDRFTAQPSAPQAPPPFPRSQHADHEGDEAGGEEPVKVPEHLVPVLLQLVRGGTDASACRKLNVSPRTFSRRVAELFDYLHVQTRFQCGAEIARRGWVAVPSDPEDLP